MIPLRDNIPSRTFPFVNLLIIVVNILAFAVELSLGKSLEPFLLWYALVPSHYAQPWLHANLTLVDYFLPFLTSMFLHGGWMHIISNMWVLYIFGDNVEDRIGHVGYFFFYLLCGLAAGVLQLLVSWGSPIPVLGASGAIAGVMGAYFLLYPFARIVTLVPIFVFFQTVELPAFLFLGLWIWSQVYSGSMAALTGAGKFGGVAWWAHVGGFLAGIMLLRVVFLRGRRTL